MSIGYGYYYGYSILFSPKKVCLLHYLNFIAYLIYDNLEGFFLGSLGSLGSSYSSCSSCSSTTKISSYSSYSSCSSRSSAGSYLSVSSLIRLLSSSIVLLANSNFSASDNGGSSTNFNLYGYF